MGQNYTSEMNEHQNPWKTKNSKLIYDNPWIVVHEHEVIHPSGKPGIYGVVGFKNTAVGIIPLDKDLNTWIVGQYRYPLKRYSWEIPEGGAPKHLPLLESAQRELREETGIEAKDWQPILEVAISNSITDELGVVYVARDLSFHEAQPEDSEELVVKKIPFQTLFEMCMRNEITDSLAVNGILKLKLLLDSGKINNK